MDLLPEQTWTQLFNGLSPYQIQQQLGEQQPQQPLEIPRILTGKRFIGCVIENSFFKSAETGARIELLPDSDPNIGFVAYDGNNAVIFKILTAGTDVGDITIGDYIHAQGIFYDASTGQLDIQGGIIVNSLDIPDIITANSFHVDVDGNAWWGATTLGAALAKILKTGIATFTDITITGGTFINTAATLAEARLNTLFKKLMYIGNVDDSAALHSFTATPGLGGTITRLLLNTTLLSAVDKECKLYSVGDGYNGWVNYDSEFICSVYTEAIVNQDIFWGLGVGTDNPLNSVLTTYHCGFIVEDGTLYASNADNVNQRKTDVSSGITLTNPNVYRVVFTQGVNCKYYINDILVATHTDRFPSASSFLINFSMTARTANKKLYLSNNYTLIMDTA